MVAAVLRKPAVWGAALCAAACATPPPLPPPPQPPQAPAEAGLHVLLSWSAPVDLDLYVTGPRWEAAYFAHPTTRTGLELVEDRRCPQTAKEEEIHVERVRVLRPAPGRYRVGVDFIDDCGSGLNEVPFLLTVVGGARMDRAGRARRERFAPVVLEIDVDSSGRLVVPSAPGGGTRP